MNALKQFEPIILASHKEVAGRSSVVVGLLGGISRCWDVIISKAYFDVPIQD